MGKIKRMQDEINLLWENFNRMDGALDNLKKDAEINKLKKSIKAMDARQGELVEEIQALRFLIKNPSGWEVTKYKGMIASEITITSVNEASTEIIKHKITLGMFADEKYNINNLYWVENGKYLEIWDKTHDRLEKVFTVKGDDIIEADLELYSCYVTRKAAA